MSGIQVLLIVSIIAIFLYFISRFRSAFIDLVMLALFSFLAIFFVVFPEYTNLIAHKLGVGRGADLLFYICILLFLFIVLKLFERLRRLEKMITEIVRQDAKDNATDNQSSKKKDQ